MDKSAMAEYSINSGHCIKLWETSILSTSARGMRLSSIPITGTERMASF
jgi:hypothetical protein